MKSIQNYIKEGRSPFGKTDAYDAALEFCKAVSDMAGPGTRHTVDDTTMRFCAHVADELYHKQREEFYQGLIEFLKDREKI